MSNNLTIINNMSLGDYEGLYGYDDGFKSPLDTPTEVSRVFLDVVVGNLYPVVSYLDRYKDSEAKRLARKVAKLLIKYRDDEGFTEDDLKRGPEALVHDLELFCREMAAYASTKGHNILEHFELTGLGRFYLTSYSDLRKAILFSYNPATINVLSINQRNELARQ